MTIGQDIVALMDINIPRITSRYGSWGNVEKQPGFFFSNARDVFGKRTFSALCRLTARNIVICAPIEHSGIFFDFYKLNMLHPRVQSALTKGD